MFWEKKWVTWRCATCNYMVSYQEDCNRFLIIHYRNHSPCRTENPRFIGFGGPDG